MVDRIYKSFVGNQIFMFISYDLFSCSYFCPLSLGPLLIAPTDDAFADLPEGTVEGLLEDIPALTSILTYHVVSGKVESGDLSTGPVTTVNGADVDISVDDDDSVRVNDSNVIIADVHACNGVIHVIDAVLIPPTPEASPEPEACDLGTIVDVAVGNGSFETLVAAVTAAELVGTLSGDGPFTVFGKLCMIEAAVFDHIMSHSCTHILSHPLYNQPPPMMPLLHFPREPSRASLRIFLH